MFNKEKRAEKKRIRQQRRSMRPTRGGSVRMDSIRSYGEGDIFAKYGGSVGKSVGPNGVL